MKAACRLFSFILILGFALTSRPSVAQQVTDTIPAGDTPWSAAVNPVTNQIYIPDQGSNYVTVIDGTTLATTTVRVGTDPFFLAVNPVTNRIYVANWSSKTVSVIDGTNNSVIKTVTVGTYPFHLAVNSVTNKIYVVNNGTNNVTVINGSNNSVIKTVAVGTDPWFLAVNPVTNQIYVANYNSNTVSVIDGTNNSVIKTITVGTNPCFLAVNTLTNQIYVANYYGKSVSVIDGTTNSVIKTITVGTNPYAPAVNPVTNRIYVTDNGSNDVAVIDGTSNSVIKTIAVGSHPYFLALNPVTNQIYVANYDGSSVSVIDGTYNSIVKTLTVGTRPYFLAVNPVTNKVYVPNQDDDTVSVIAGATGSASQFVPVTPCRLVDTRNSKSPIPGGTSRTFNIPQLGGCGIPSSATAYSLNVTAVPPAPLGYLTIWPTGEDQPRVSTMNSMDGRVKANAAIVSAGYQGAVNVFASNTTDLVLDINGYFASVINGPTLTFYPLTPCRVADTRNPKGPLGGPYLRGGAQRDLPILQSNCGIPNTAQAYSFNFTAVPHGPLGYLTVWPTGQKQPGVSTLNALTGTVVANAAILPAGKGGDIDVFASNDSDLVIDVNGYFAPADSGGLSLYPMAPCRVQDTRQTGGLFSGTLGSDVAASPCEPPETAQAYVFNATVVPQGALGYLTLWPNGESQPVVSTLNAIDGAVTSNQAIVPNLNGWIDAYASNLTQLVLDISSYFAP